MAKDQKDESFIIQVDLITAAIGLLTDGELVFVSNWEIDNPSDYEFLISNEVCARATLPLGFNPNTPPEDTDDSRNVIKLIKELEEMT